MTSPTPVLSAEARLAELERSLRAVRERLAAACAEAGRDVSEVTLVAVSKTRPARDVLLLHSLGVTDMGESYDQEAAAKAAAVGAAGAHPRWHLVGQLQRNKARSAAGYAHLVHSVDRPELAAALGAAAQRQDRELGVCVQVRLDDDPARGGVDASQVADLADVVAAQAGLRLRGVMAVAPRGLPARPAFARLRAVAESLREAHPDADVVSAGMSSDLEDAIAEGATHVRVGSAIFGSRPLAD